MGNKYDSTNLFLETYSYDNWFKSEKLADLTKGCEEESADLPPMPPVKVDEEEEVKEKKGV